MVEEACCRVIFSKVPIVCQVMKLFVDGRRTMMAVNERALKAIRTTTQLGKAVTLGVQL